MTAVEEAAFALISFIRANVQPYDSPASQADEWPIEIAADNPETCMELASLMQSLEDEFKAAGRPVLI